MERRRPERELLAHLDRRTWHLWVLTLSISVSLALGISVLLYPALAWKVDRLGARLAILPQLVTGLLVLIVLQSVYVVLKQKQVNEMREFIISRYAETWIREDLARDPLTGVLDRRTLPDIMERERAWADRYNLPLCLILLDIRGFREINERGGHLAGDIILKDLAHTLQSTVRQTDTVIRHGPDEFLCFLPRTDQVGGEGFTHRLAKRCQEVARLRDLPLDFGIAVYEAGMNSDGVLTEVERQLTSNKSPVPSPAHLQRSAAEPL
jgi:diguanylate cyclase (GGDEF)-like protein